MKLTTEQIRQLIKEEIAHIINEGTPRNYIDKGKVNFNKKNIKFFVYKSGTLDHDQIDPHVGASHVGHYHVKRHFVPKSGTKGALYNAIQSIRHQKQMDPKGFITNPANEEYVVGIDDTNIVTALQQSNDI